MIRVTKGGIAMVGGDSSVRCSRWFAVYTKPRQEQTALLNLERQSFECFLPLTNELFPRRVRASAAEGKPLFPRYLFLRAAPETQNLATVRSTRGVIGLVRAGAELIDVPSAVIAELRSRIRPETGLIELDRISLVNGDVVRVADGPFATLEGIFKERRGRTRSLMLLEILGQKIEVDISSRLLQRAD